MGLVVARVAKGLGAKFTDVGTFTGVNPDVSVETAHVSELLAAHLQERDKKNTFPHLTTTRVS